MTLSKREQYMLIGGAVVVALTVLIAWVMLPLARKWNALGRELEPKLEALALLRERTERHEALLARRARLVRDLGLLVESADGAGKQDAKGQPQDPAGEEAAPQPESGGPPSPAGGAKPERGSPALEALIEKAVTQAGGRVKLVSAKKGAGRSMALEHFEMVALQVETELSAESLTKLLHALEKGPRFVRVEGLRLHHDFKKPDALGVTLEIVAYERAGRR